jgi:prophage maintenance system killer protein
MSNSYIMQPSLKIQVDQIKEDTFMVQLDSTHCSLNGRRSIIFYDLFLRLNGFMLNEMLSSINIKNNVI